MHILHMYMYIHTQSPIYHFSYEHMHTHAFQGFIGIYARACLFIQDILYKSRYNRINIYLQFMKKFIIVIQTRHACMHACIWKGINFIDTDWFLITPMLTNFFLFSLTNISLSFRLHNLSQNIPQDGQMHIHTFTRDFFVHR